MFQCYNSCYNYNKKMGRLHIKASLKSFIHDETGAAAIEYGLMAALVSVAMIVAVQLVGTNINLMFMQIATKLQSISTSRFGGTAIGLSR